MPSYAFAGLGNGDLVIISCSVNRDASPTASGWTKIYQSLVGSGTRRQTQVGFARIISGSTSATIDIGDNETIAAVVWGIQNHGVTNVGSDIQVSEASGYSVPSFSVPPGPDHLALLAISGWSGSDTPGQVSGQGWVDWGGITSGSGLSGSALTFAHQTVAGGSSVASGSSSSVTTSAVIRVPGAAASAVQKIAVGSALLDADSIRLGASTVDRIYVGAELIYGPSA